MGNYYTSQHYRRSGNDFFSNDISISYKILSTIFIISKQYSIFLSYNDSYQGHYKLLIHSTLYEETNSVKFLTHYVGTLFEFFQCKCFLFLSSISFFIFCPSESRRGLEIEKVLACIDGIKTSKYVSSKVCLSCLHYSIVINEIQKAARIFISCGI